MATLTVTTPQRHPVAPTREGKAVATRRSAATRGWTGPRRLLWFLRSLSATSGTPASMRPKWQKVCRGLASKIVAQVIWDKGLFAMGRSWYHWSHEPCWVVRRKGAKVRFLGSRDQATIWNAPSPKMIMAGSAEPRLDHPTQKPLVLFETPIHNHLKVGEALYEPFCGSGTALVAAERTGTRCYAMEIDPIYLEVALRRWERFAGSTAERIDV